MKIKKIRYKQHVLTKPTLKIIKLKNFIRIAFPLLNRKIKLYILCCRKQNKCCFNYILYAQQQSNQRNRQERDSATLQHWPSNRAAFAGLLEIDTALKFNLLFNKFATL